MIRQSPAGVVFDVRVIPRAQATAAAGMRDDAILIRLAAPPVEGAANDALLRFLSHALGVPQRAVCLLKGTRSRTKRVEISGVTEAQLRTVLLK